MGKLCRLGLVLAWVMWIRTQGPTADDWSAVTGYSSREQCLTNVKQKIDVWRYFKDAKFTENSVFFSENNTTVSYACLPASEDPRPKRKS